MYGSILIEIPERKKLLVTWEIVVENVLLNGL
jgi:hypothetical protein